MLVVIPTFKRIDRLRWALLSLMQAELPDCSERFVVCLANNYYPTRTEVHNLVAEVKSQTECTRWEWRLLDREKTLEPVDNWYSAIASLADEGEVVFLSGDDDLFLPWSLVDRYRAAIESETDLLLSRAVGGLVFLSDEKSVYFRGTMPTRQKGLHAEPVEWRDMTGSLGVFIGNHCYRYTEHFREALALGFRWCHEQDWLDRNIRTLMLPSYLPWAVKQIGAKLVGIRQVCAIRGTGLAENVKAPFGMRGWNSGLLILSQYGVLTNKDLGPNTELESARLKVAQSAADFFWTLFFDKRIPPQTRKETLRRIRLPISPALLKPLLFGLKRVLVQKMRLSNLRIRIRASIQSQPATTFLESMKNFD